MAEIIKFSPNMLEYPHVACGVCGGDSFHVSTDYDGDIEVFHSIVCSNTECGNVIHVGMRPVFRGDGETENGQLNDSKND